MKRAASTEELQPLVRMCRTGMLFDVVEWIRTGQPIALPEASSSKARKHNPLRIAVESGFHSIVQVLLQARAPISEGSYSALAHAVELRRPDLVALLFEQGASPSQISMRLVVEMWNPEVIDLFIAQGASFTRDNALAWGLMNKIRPALGLVKRFGPSDPAIMQQADFALRFHAGEGNLKWVSLLLWADANPLTKGWYRFEDLDDPERPLEEPEGSSAIEIAIVSRSMDVLSHKKMLPRPDPAEPQTLLLLDHACHSGCEVLALVLSRGHEPALLPDRGTGGLTSVIAWMAFDVSFRDLQPGSLNEGIDSDRSREMMKMLHMLIANGAQWLPENAQRISDSRKHFLKLAPKYILEFVWLLQTYKAGRRHDVEELIRTPSMTRWLGRERARMMELIALLPENIGD